MSAPNLTVVVEPSANNALMYLPLAPKSASDPPRSEIALEFQIRNNEAIAVQLTGLAISFPESSSSAGASIAPDINIPSHGTAIWNFATANDLVTPFPAPGHIGFAFTCHGFSEPMTLTLPLVAAGAPVPGGFDFPASATDLRLTEYWTGQSLTHAAGAQGSQLFAYDMVVVGLDPSSHNFSNLLPGTNNTNNSDSRSWGKPVRAVADGAVLEAENDVPNNPAPLSWTSTADLNAKLQAQGNNFWNKPQFKNPGAGNHFYLQHGDHVVLYAHMQKGSLNPALLQTGAVVKRGEFLGFSGNAGNSTGPHLHIHAIKGTAPETGPLRPLPYRDMWVVETTAVHPPDPSGPWVKSADQGLPVVTSLIWPASTKPSWYPPGWGEITRSGVANADFQAEFNKVTSSGYRMVWIDGFDVGGEPYFNMIFRPEDGTVWEAEVGLDAEHYQTEFDKWQNAGYRPLHVETFLKGGNALYAGIWAKSPGPAWSAYHGRSAAFHQSQFDTLTKQGYVPVVVSAVEASGGLLYTALYEKTSMGGFVLSGAVNFHDYQTETDANIAAGRRPASLNAISNGGNPLMLALWEQNASANFVARHGLSAAQYQAEYDLRLQQGYLTRAVSGCDNGNGTALYAAIWSK
ncbi:MAG TPA: peptidoglycan DD-metalloendopeptidase family protein [Stellaceae bacterium]|jgi:hypothetical protein